MRVTKTPWRVAIRELFKIQMSLSDSDKIRRPLSVNADVETCENIPEYQTPNGC